MGAVRRGRDGVLRRNSSSGRRTIGRALGRPTASLDRFDAAHLFSGPRAYFHFKVIRQRRTMESVHAAIADTSFLEGIYATLTAWGMHRMGPGNARLVEFDAFVTTIRDHAIRLGEFDGVALQGITASKLVGVTESLWEVIAASRIGVGRTRIVAGTKTLHHLLPDLVPPMDRAYTESFFFGAERTFNAQAFQNNERAAFGEIFPRLADFARRHEATLDARRGLGMHTSLPKSIDNAIVGYMLAAR